MIDVFRGAGHQRCFPPFQEETVSVLQEPLGKTILFVAISLWLLMSFMLSDILFCFNILEGQQAIQVVFQVFQVGDNRVAL